jgi:hypothetical protein
MSGLLMRAGKITADAAFRLLTRRGCSDTLRILCGKKS